MASNSRNHRRPAAGNREPVLVRFPNALRNDGLANTYMGADGSSILVPNVPHDFDFTRRLAAAGLTKGTVATLGEEQGVRYSADSDLVGLAAVMNAAIRVEDGRQDIVHTLELVGKLTLEMKRRLGALPLITTIEAVAVDRSTNTAELLPPYQVSAEIDPEAVFQNLQQDAYGRSRSPLEDEMIAQCFSVAQGSFTE